MFTCVYRCLNVPFCQSDVVISCVVIVCGHISFVDYAGDGAFVIQCMGIVFFFSAVTFVLRCDVVVVNEDFLVVVVVLVKDGVEIVVWWEVFLDQVEEGFGDVGLYIFAVWGLNLMMFLLLFLFLGVVAFLLQQ